MLVWLVLVALWNLLGMIETSRNDDTEAERARRKQESAGDGERRGGAGTLVQGCRADVRALLVRTTRALWMEMKRTLRRMQVELRSCRT